MHLKVNTCVKFNKRVKEIKTQSTSSSVYPLSPCFSLSWLARSTYFCLASSWLMPFLPFQASHLAFPWKFYSQYFIETKTMSDSPWSPSCLASRCCSRPRWPAWTGRRSRAAHRCWESCWSCCSPGPELSGNPRQDPWLMMSEFLKGHKYIVIRHVWINP